MTSQAYCDAVAAIHALEVRVSQFGRSLRRGEELGDGNEEETVDRESLKIMRCRYLLARGRHFQPQIDAMFKNPHPETDDPKGKAE